MRCNQFLVNSEDEKVIDYLKKLTFMGKEEIEAYEEKVKTEPHLREAQRHLLSQLWPSSMVKKNIRKH